MAKPKKKRRTAPAEGERAAIGGYHPQYRLSADAILKSLRHDTLEWIRLADPTAGRVDDFQIGTPGRVDGFQVKWSRDGGNFTFRGLTTPDDDKPCLIAQLADGWKILQQNHSNRRIVVHLSTNEVPSVTKLIDRDGSDSKGSFAEFLNQVWFPAHESGAKVPNNWQHAWDSLAKYSTLNSKEFAQFVSDCKLEFGVMLPGKLDPGTKSDPIFESDLRQLTEFLQSVVADPAHVTELDRAMLLKQLGWTNRLTYVSRHEFPDPTNQYSEIKDSADQLRFALQNLDQGYVALLGDPGSGKSTLLTKTLLALPHRVIRYYAFVPDSPDSRSLRGEATSFLHDITLSLDHAGFRSGQSISNRKDIEQLAQRFQEQLQLLHRNWCDTGCKTIILVDGLDHIPRELKPKNSLLKYLPHPDQIPEGVLVALGSQTDQLSDLPNPVQYSITRHDRRIHIARLSRNSVLDIIEQANLIPALRNNHKRKIEDLIAGHPLALALLINRLSNTSEEETVDDILNSMEPFGGQIDEIYYSHWRQVIDDQQDNELSSLLGKIVRLRPTLDLQWIESWAGTAVVDRLRRKLYHLFRRENAHRWYFFHNSFRIFLLHRTAESFPNGFDENRDKRIHLEIADICAKEPRSNYWNWEEIYHRKCAGQHKEVIALANFDRLKTQLYAFRPIEAIQNEIRMAVVSAGVLRDFVVLSRLLFSGADFKSRDQIISSTSIHELLLGIGEFEKACMHIRDGNTLRVNADSAINFSLELMDMGLNKEARLIFEIAEPINLFKNPSKGERDLQREQVDTLRAWANASIFYRSIIHIVSLIRGIKQNAFTFDRNIDQSQKVLALQNDLLAHVGVSLIKSQKWDDFELILGELEGPDLKTQHLQFQLFVHAWKECYRCEDIPRAKQFVERGSSLFELDELNDKEKIQLVEAILRVLDDKKRAKTIFDNVEEPILNTNSAIKDRFESYMQRFQYNRLLYTFGDKRSATELIPDSSDSRYEGAVYLERGLSEIARLWSMSWSGTTLDGPMFVREAKQLFFLFCRDWNTDRGRELWSFLARYRSEFYLLLVKAAQKHGSHSVAELAYEFKKEWFENDRSRYWSKDDIRSILRSLYSAGVDRAWCHKVLERLETLESQNEDTDISGRVSWRENQAWSWIHINEPERARSLLDQMLNLSAGIGYRKDYQLDSWVEWMRIFNLEQLNGKIDRTQFMASAIISMVETTEGGAATTAAALLIEATFDWSPLRAVALCRLFSENDVIAFASGAAIIVKKAIETDNPPYELCLSYCTELLIPISTTAESSLVSTLIRRLGETRGKNEAIQATHSLINSINVYALPETRNDWHHGIIAGIKQLDISLDEFIVDLQSDGDIDDHSLIKLNLTNGSQISKKDLTAKINSPDDLFILIENEASDSYYDWTSHICELVRLMNANEVFAFFERLQIHRPKAEQIVVLSERLLELGDQSRAWHLGIKAVEYSDKNGWSKYYDGGSLQAAFKVLIKVDPERGRVLAFDSFVEYLNSDWWYPLDTVMNLEIIAPILCNSVPVIEIWSNIENYLQNLFSDISFIDSTILELDDNEEDSPQRALATLNCQFLGHPAHLLSEGAIRSCADLLQRNNPDILFILSEKLQNSDAETFDILIVLDATSKHDTSILQYFENHIKCLRRSPNQSIRWIANQLANRLNLPSATISLSSKNIVSKYRGRVLLNGSSQFFLGSEKNSIDFLADSQDPHELVSPWHDDIEAISSGVGIPFEAIIIRVVEFMREIAPESTWNCDAEQELRSHMDKSELKISFRRLRPSQARQAIFHVLAELVDGCLIPNETLKKYERMFRNYDPSLVLSRPVARPKEIPPVICPEYNEFKTEWVESVYDEKLYPMCNAIGDCVVVAEYTKLRPAGNKFPIEYRKSVLYPQSMPSPNCDMDDSHFFPPLFRALVTTYHESSSELGVFPAVLHCGYGYETPGEGWLALNPNLGQILEWKPSDKGFLSWEKDGQLMVQTIWWNEGSPYHSMPYYRKFEVGEGWLVVATKEAINQIDSEIGPFKRVSAVTREIVEDRECFRNTRYIDTDV